MILSYSKKFPWGEPTNFEEKILTGIKKHTIREDPHDRWKPGMKIHHATGVRTKNYKCFHEGECLSTQKIKIKYDDEGIMHVIVDGQYFDFEYGEPQELAYNDGFNKFEDFARWFDSDFEGKLIHWTPLTY